MWSTSWARSCWVGWIVLSQICWCWGYDLFLSRKSRLKIRRPLRNCLRRMIDWGRIFSFCWGICRLISRANWRTGCRRLWAGWWWSTRRGWGRRRRSRRIWIWGSGWWLKNRWARRWRTRPNMIQWTRLCGMSCSRRRRASGHCIGPWRTSSEAWWGSCRLKVVGGRSSKPTCAAKSEGCSKIWERSTIYTKTIRASWCKK